MKGLNTARVLIVDDDTRNDEQHRSEALALIRAFARWGIGTVFHSGDVEDVPPNPNLHGIRLAAVDLDLTNVYGAEARAVVGPTLNVMRALIEENNGPYLALAWTKHEDLIEAFREGVSNLPCPPVQVAYIEKAAVQDVNGEFITELILEKLASGLDEAYPLAFFNTWEQLVHEAATSTVSATTESAGEWSTVAAEMLAALLRGSSHDLADSTICLRALLEALNPLHFDHLEALTFSQPGEEVPLVNRLQDLASKGKTAPEMAAVLNRRLLIGQPITSPSPGDIYLLDDVVESVGGAPTRDDLKDDMLEPNQKDTQPATGCVPVLVEVTPICDYQNGDMKVARFVAGLAVPANATNVLKSARTAFIRRLEPIAFQHGGLTGEYVLAWTAHYLVTTLPASLAEYEPVCRLRQPPLVDLQAWAAGQASRPGYLSVRAAGP